MKRLKAGVVNSISFIRNLEYSVNSFDVTFDKVVGGTTLTLSDLEDVNELDPCKDFIVINIDLLSNELDGGEYYMTISNGGGFSTYLCEVESYVYNTLGNSIYGDSVVLSGSVGSTPVLENPDAGGSTGSNTGGGTIPSNVTIELFEGTELYLKPDSESQAVSLSITGVDENTDYRIIMSVTDSDQNQKDYTSVQTYNTQFYFNLLDTDGVNYGDAWETTYSIETLDGTLLATSPNYLTLVPPQIQAAFGLTAVDAEARVTNEEYDINLARYEAKDDWSIAPAVSLPLDHKLWAKVLSNKLATIEYTKQTINSGNTAYVPEVTALEPVLPVSLENAPDWSPVSILSGGTYFDLSNIYNADSQYDVPQTHEFTVTNHLIFSWEKDGTTYKTPVATNPYGDTYVSSEYDLQRTVRLTEFEEDTIDHNGNILTIAGELPIVHKDDHLVNDSTLYLFLGNYTNGVGDLNTNKFSALYLKMYYTDGTYGYRTYGPDHADITIANGSYSGLIGTYDPPSSAIWIKADSLEGNPNESIVWIRAWIKYGSPGTHKVYHIDNNTGYSPHYHRQ